MKHTNLSYLFLLIINVNLQSQDLANYGTPTHSSINNTVGTVVQDQVSPAYIISHKEAVERINIETETERYILGDQAYLLFDYNSKLNEFNKTKKNNDNANFLIFII